MYFNDTQYYNFRGATDDVEENTPPSQIPLIADSGNVAGARQVMLGSAGGHGIYKNGTDGPCDFPDTNAGAMGAGRTSGTFPSVLFLIPYAGVLVRILLVLKIVLRLKTLLVVVFGNTG